MSAAAPEAGSEIAPDRELNLYLRAVWARLAAGAFAAALSAWCVSVIPLLRSSIVIEHANVSLGLTLFGVSLVAAPFIIWAGARIFARGPNLLNPAWYWLFVIGAGAATNALAVLFLREAVVSIFISACIGFGAIQLAHRLADHVPSWLTALIFIGAALGGDWVIDAVLKEAWSFTALDIAAIAGLALLIAFRAGAFQRIRQNLKRPGAKGAGVTYAAMHLIALAAAPKPPPSVAQGASAQAHTPRAIDTLIPQTISQIPDTRKEEV